MKKKRHLKMTAIALSATMLLSFISTPVVYAGTVEETPGLQLQTVLFQNGDSDHWTTESWGGANILPNTSWRTTDIYDYYYNGQLSFDVKSNGTEALSFRIGLTSYCHSETVTIYWTDLEAYKGKVIAGTDWTTYTLPIKELVDAFPDSGFDLSNLRKVSVSAVKSGETISLCNVKISSADDERQYPFIKVNQVGYTVNGAKTARISYFAKFGSLDGKTYEIVDKTSGEIILTGTLGEAELNEHLSGESVHIISFDELTTQGTYYIRIPDTGFDSSVRSPRDVEDGLETDTLTSASFQIGDTIYEDLLSDMTKYYYYQRQGLDLDEKYAGDFARKNLHPGDAEVRRWSDRENPNAEIFDITQGWYDAGDYGKYTSSAATSVENLLLAYDLYPQIFQDMELNIPETDPTNPAYADAPGYLSEIKWEIDMLLKLEHSSKDGSFYVAANYNNGVIYLEDTLYQTSDYNSPAEQRDLRSHLATAEMAAMLAHAYLIYKNIPVYADFAETCLETSLRAWDWINDPANPQHQSIGAANRTYTYKQEELDRSMFWAAGTIYRAQKAAGGDTTPYESYLLNNCETENVTKCFTGASLGYHQHGRSLLGFFHYLYQNDEADAKMTEIFQKAISWRERIMSYDNWGTDHPDWGYWWGSNMVITQCATSTLLSSILLEGKENIPDEVILSGESAFNYMLGVNPISFSYISGYGENCVENIYSAIYSGDAKLDPYRCPAGYVTEGTNPSDNRQLSKFDGKCYMDSDAEFTTNENTIYGNAAMIFLTASIMSRIESKQIKGDVNVDGSFNITDVVIMQKWLLTVPDTHLVDWKAGDLCEDDRLDVFDLCLMKRELLKQ